MGLQNTSNNNKPNFSIDKEAYINEMLQFIDMKISLFPKYLSNSLFFQNISEPFESEDRITESLCSFLIEHEREHLYTITKQDNFSFSFKNQPKGDGHRTYDMSVIIGSTKADLGNIFIFEAKRLPTPGTGREKEYVIGNGGAIERYKTNAHGKTFKKAGIIGYIQKETPVYWFNKINEWIDAEITSSSNSSLNWETKDKLIANNSTFDKHKSTHSRICGNDIELLHFWIDLDPKS